MCLGKSFPFFFVLGICIRVKRVKGQIWDYKKLQTAFNGASIFVLFT